MKVRAAHTLFDPQALAHALQGRFAIAPIDDCAFHRSFINDTYRVSAGGRRYFLRVYQAGWRTPVQALAEMRLIERIAAAGGPVACPVRLCDGDFVLEIEAPEAARPAVLVEEAPGTELAYSGADGPANAARYGRAAARVHNAADAITGVSDRPPMDMQALLDDPLRIIAGRLQAEADRVDLENAGRRLREIVTQADGLTVGFAHGDLNSSNIHFTDRQATVIDFDCCGWGWRANDIAAFGRGVTLTRSPGPEADALIDAYLRGYGEERPISPQDRAMLPAFLLIQRIWMASLHLAGRDRWGEIHFGPAYAARLVAWLRAWLPILTEPPAWARG